MPSPAHDPESPQPGILVVDDDKHIRNLLHVGLPLYGFSVWLAADGKEAVELYRRVGQDIAVVLLDVRMPGIGGPQTLSTLQALNPAVRSCFERFANAWHTQRDLGTNPRCRWG